MATDAGGAAGIEHRHLRDALEFAVLIAAEGQKRKPPIPSPKEFKPYFSRTRLPNSALGRLRRAVENDPVFRRRLSAGALPELVDEVGRIWLEHADDWARRAAELTAAADAEAEEADLATRLRSAEKRRDAAEQAAARTRTELLHRDDVIAMQSTEIDDLRADVEKAQEALREMRTELSDLRMEIRHARDREAAAVARAKAAEAARAAPEPAAAVESDASSELAAELAGHRARVASAAATAHELAEHLAALAALATPAPPVTASTRRGSASTARRAPLALPGGVIASSAEAAAFLFRSDAAIFVDAYNVAKLAWPDRTLERQRSTLIDALENLARRFDADITAVFDGASVVGSHAPVRRSIRVVYSPAGTTADDVIRAEIRACPPHRAVVVVTNDNEIVRDVKAMGANVVPSNALLAVT